MSTIRPEFSPSTQEPAVMHPQLLQMVEAARSQPMPEVAVDAETLHAAWKQRKRSHRTVLGSLVVAAAAAAIVTLAVPWSSSSTPSSDSSAALESIAVAPTVAQEATVSVDTTPATELADSVASAPPILSESITVQALEPSSVQPEVLGAHHLRLPTGWWSIDSVAAEPVQIEVGEQRLEIQRGHVQVRVAAEAVVDTQVLRGALVHLSSDGRVVARSGPSQTADAGPASAERATRRPARPGPDALAQEADEHLAAGRRGRAIKSLRRLVTQYPRSAAAPTALIDLGRLLDRAGRDDEARCAYGLFLQRWPQLSSAGEVRRAREALGEGSVRCRGLTPRR